MSGRCFPTSQSNLYIPRLATLFSCLKVNQGQRAQSAVVSFALFKSPFKAIWMVITPVKKECFPKLCFPQKVVASISKDATTSLETFQTTPSVKLTSNDVTIVQSYNRPPPKLLLTQFWSSNGCTNGHSQIMTFWACGNQLTCMVHSHWTEIYHLSDSNLFYLVSSKKCL